MEHGTERLADASFLEELLRGRRTVVLTFGDPAPAQHLAKRLGAGIVLVDGDAASGQRDGSAEAVVAIGGFQDDKAIDALVAEGKRLLARGGLFAASWIDASRPSLEAPPGEAKAAIAGLDPAEASRRLQGKFGHVAVVARQPYLGFQYVTGTDGAGALTLDSSLSSAPDAPTGYLALASDIPIPLADALIQVPYDRAVARVSKWVRELPIPQAIASTPPPPSGGRQTGVVRAPAPGAEEMERLRGEVSALRERAQGAIEEADRARGEVRSARERAALLEAEVGKLRGRIRGIPEAEAEKLRNEIAERSRERDQARRDAEGAGAEAARALEAAANLEREVEFLQARVAELDRETETLRAEKARSEEDAGMRLRDARAELKTAKADLEKLRTTAAEAQAEAKSRAAEARDAEARATALAAEIAGLQAKAPDADALAAAAKRARDFEERFREANAKLAAANEQVSALEGAKQAAERAAEDAWKRVQEAKAAAAQAGAPAAAASAASAAPSNAAPAGELVPAADLDAVERALAEAIARADAAERALTAARESAEPGEGVSEGAGLAAEAEARRRKALEQELNAMRRRADEAEARVASLERVSEDAKARADAASAAQRTAGGTDAEGLRSLLHQRETALAEARSQIGAAEARAARFASESAEALERLRVCEETLAEREVELKRALGALDGVEQREERDRELMAELKGEVARLTEASTATRAELARVQAQPNGGATASAAAERDDAIRAAAMAQTEAARTHAEADALREQLEKLRAETETLRAEKSKTGDQAAERERRIAELEAKLLEARAQGSSSSDMERRSVAMAQRLSELEAELERARDDVKQATAEARKYRALAEAIEPPAGETNRS